MNNQSDNDSSQQEGGPVDEPSDEIVALYCRHIPEYLSELQVAVRSNDEDAIAFQCHKMSSAVKTLGFDNISALLDTIQNDKPTGDELNSLFDRVEKLIGHTLLLLNK